MESGIRENVTLKCDKKPQTVTSVTKPWQKPENKTNDISCDKNWSKKPEKRWYTRAHGYIYISISIDSNSSIIRKTRKLSHLSRLSRRTYIYFARASAHSKSTSQEIGIQNTQSIHNPQDKKICVTTTIYMYVRNEVWHVTKPHKPNSLNGLGVSHLFFLKCDSVTKFVFSFRFYKNTNENTYTSFQIFSISDKQAR